MQDRGNEALPEDVVKVLKTQDENYLRTMRTAGLKVSGLCSGFWMRPAQPHVCRARRK